MKKVKVKKINVPRVILLIGILLGLVGLTFNFVRVKYPKEMISVSSQNKEFGRHKTIKKKKDDKFYVLHYPKTKIKEVDKQIKDFMDLQLNQTNYTQIKQDYEALEIDNRYVSIKLMAYQDNELKDIKAFTFDTNENTMINGSIFKPKATRLLTNHLRENIDANIDNYYKITQVNQEFQSIFVNKDNIEFIINKEVIPFSLNQHVNYLEKDFAGLKANDEKLPSTYVDYGYENSKMVAFTFDDGPHFEYNYKIMDIFEKYDGQATFFMLGSRIDGLPEVIPEILDRGHQVAGHSYDHPNFLNLTELEVIKQIENTEKAIYNASGYNGLVHVRPPYGAITNELASKFDVPFIHWSVDTEDWRVRDANTVCNNIKNYSYDGAIILMHELYESSYESLDCALSSLKSDGYQFVTVQELLLAKGTGITPGKIYYDAN